MNSVNYKLFRGKRVNKSKPTVLLCAMLLICCAATHAFGSHHGIESSNIRFMQMLTRTKGWVVVGDQLLWSDHSGKEWRDITPVRDPNQGIENGYFLDTAHGWVLLSKPGSDASTAGELILASTKDSGGTWTFSTFPATAFILDRYGSASVFFSDLSHGWIVLKLNSSSQFSYGELFATSDGGLTWTKLARPPTGESARFSSASNGWMLGWPHNHIYVTRDGGNSWQKQALSRPTQVNPGSEMEYDLPTFGTANDGVLPVQISEQKATSLAVYRSHDGGQHWDLDKVTSDAPAGSHIASAVVDSTVIRAFRNGDHITVAKDSVSNASAPIATGAISQIEFKDQGHGWVFVQSGHCVGFKTGCSQQTSLFLTEDGGNSFVEVTPNPPTAPGAESGELRAIPAAHSADAASR